MSFAKARIQVRTLRGRLTLWYLSILGLSLAAFAALSYVMVARSLYSHHDEALAAEVNRLADVVPGESAGAASALSDIPDLPAYATLWSADGRRLFDSADSRANSHRGCPPSVRSVSGRVGALTFFTAEAGRAGPIRFVCAPLGPRAGPVLQLGLALGDVSRTLRVVATASGIMLPVVLLLTSFGGLVIARRALAPLASIAGTMKEIQATDLSRRIDVHPSEEELNQLVAVLNQLLARLEGAFGSLREFAADASHQLQTPLTVAKGSIEVALHARLTGAEFDALLGELLEEVNRMIVLVSDLHALSVADMGPAQVGRGPAGLSEVVRSAAEIVQALGEQRQVSVNADVADDLMVWGEETRLRQVVLNLGENAVKYTPAGGRVDIRLARDGRHAVLQVADTGSGIGVDDLPHIFERFYRGAHTAHASGTGLGLTIAQRIVVAHGGTIEVRSKVDEGSAFVVCLPLA